MKNLNRTGTPGWFFYLFFVFMATFIEIIWNWKQIVISLRSIKGFNAKGVSEFYKLFLVDLV